MLLYMPNAVLGIRSRSDFFYQSGSLTPICSLSKHSLSPSLTVVKIAYKKFIIAKLPNCRPEPARNHRFCFVKSANCRILLKGLWMAVTFMGQFTVQNQLRSQRVVKRAMKFRAENVKVIYSKSDFIFDGETLSFVQ